MHEHMLLNIFRFRHAMIQKHRWRDRVVSNLSVGVALYNSNAERKEEDWIRLQFQKRLDKTSSRLHIQNAFDY